MIRMTGPDFVVMCNLINIHTHTRTHTHTHTHTHTTGRGWRPVDEHKMGTRTGTGTEARTVAEMGTGTKTTGTRIRSGRAEERRRSARNRKIVVDAMRETGETWVERGKNVEKKGLVQ